VSELPPWNPYPLSDWRGTGGQPPYQGGTYRELGEPPTDPETPPERRNRHTVRNVLGGIGILAVAGLVVSALSSNGTGASAGSRTSPSAAPASATASAVAVQAAAAASSAAARDAVPGKVGSAFSIQDGSGDTYQVTLLKVIDPAKSADPFMTPQPGSRIVGVVFRITALAGSPQGEDANNDATILGSDGQAYTAGFDGIAGYSNFEVGVIHLAQGGTAVGAVTFQVPQFVTVVAIRWTADGGDGSTVQWYIGTQLALFAVLIRPGGSAVRVRLVKEFPARRGGR
jgi:hypothetical protein